MVWQYTTSEGKVLFFNSIFALMEYQRKEKMLKKFKIEQEPVLEPWYNRI